MPFEDGTGPNGIGSTGWRKGPCRGLNAKEMDSDSFRGFGRFYGRCFGRGFRGARRFYNKGFHANYSDEFLAENYSKEERIKLLKKEKELIEEELNKLEK